MRLDQRLAEELVFGVAKERRFTQDSPVMPDVWLRYAENPSETLRLLLTPYGEVPSGKLSTAVRERLRHERGRSVGERRPGSASEFLPVAYNQSVVSADLRFGELVRVVLPLSDWWWKRIRKKGSVDVVREIQTIGKRSDLERVIDPHREPTEQEKQSEQKRKVVDPEFLWMVRLIGIIEFCRESSSSAMERDSSDDTAIFRRVDIANNARGIIGAVERLLRDLEPAETTDPQVYSVNLNRAAGPAITRSIRTVKADAANRLFSSSCKDLTWAIVDSGIDAQHKGFRRRDEAGKLYQEPFTDKEGKWKNQTRIVATYDFTVVSHLLNVDELSSPELPEALRQRMEENPEGVKDLRLSLNSGREIDWDLLVPFIQIPHETRSYKRPLHEHGTHVAGILAADWPADDPENSEEEDVRGTCPDLKLYDLRVLGDDGTGDEFSVMAAMQFVRHLNAHKDVMVIHGINVSLSIPHRVANYACGRTPVCEECERLIGAGIVVVAASGNRGYEHFKTSSGDEEGYRSISITDPGNAEGVITVGATHVSMPHSYGVSYFSSRGPTGDGRPKPDLVAPGEKIRSLIPGNGMKVMDGTSMASPHVCGAAALLMARHPELIGDPERIKRILCESATDLGRERYFQGAGLVDILRALQSI